MMASKRLAKWRRVTAVTTAACCIAYALAAMGVWGVLRVAGERWWPATLLLFSPRWIWGVPVLALLPISLIFCRRWALLVAASGVAVLFGLMSFRVPWRLAIPEHTGAHPIRIVTANLHNRQVNPTVLDAFIAQTHPDIVTLQDYVPRLKLGFLHEPGWHVRAANGLLVASRWPLEYQKSFASLAVPRSPLEQKWWVPGGAAILCCDVQTPAGALHLINLHLTSPHRPLDILRKDTDAGSELLEANSIRRRGESLAISRAIARIGGAFILAGDFNTPDDSPIFRVNWSGFSDAFDTAGIGFGTTYAKHHTWLRIDHVLSNGGWHARACRTSGDIGSGHRAVFAKLERESSGR